MAFKTWSFQDISCVINHPDIGQLETNGQGVGSISTSNTNVNTIHDLGADGTVMVSKVKANNGMVSITVQQTSTIHNWLLQWYNYIRTAPAKYWAEATITIRNTNQFVSETTQCTGVSPEKRADRGYQAQGQMVTWNLMCADITEIGA